MLRGLYRCEILCAASIAAFGMWWAAHAARRLKVLSKEHSGNGATVSPQSGEGDL